MFGISRKKMNCGLQILDRQIKLIGTTGTTQHKIVNYHTVPLNIGLIKEGKILDEEALVQSLSSAQQQLSLSNQEVTLTIPTSSIVLRKAMFPNVKDKELRNLIDVELHGGDSKLPFKNPVFDFIPLREVGKEKEVLIFASPSEVVDQYVNIVRRAGFKPIAVDSAPLALFRIMTRIQKAAGQTMPERFMLLDAEGDRADISIFVDGYPVFFRSLAISSNQLHQEGVSQLDAYTQQISIELGRVMNYYKYSVASSKHDVEELILVGDPILTESLTTSLAKEFTNISELQMDYVIPYFEAIYKSFAVPIGLAMKGA